MSPKELTDLLTPIAPIATGIVALSTAIVGLTKYFNYRTRDDDKRLIKQAFDSMITSLRSENLVDRLSGAIILRRFYDYKTEMGSGGAPYWKVALDVTAAILRGQATSDFQKLLADGLAFAPNLIRADLQKTNLQFAYLGARKTGDDNSNETITDLRHADFYRADLSKASLKRANAQRAVFYQSRLHNTVFSGADLTEANFFDADLKGAIFRGTVLFGANFSCARNLPPGLSEKLDETGKYQDRSPFQTPEGESQEQAPTVFVSKPGCLSARRRQELDSLLMKLTSRGILTRTLERKDYPSFGVIGEVRRLVSGCTGAIVFGFSELTVLNGMWRADTPDERAINDHNYSTPWAQLEAGMAVMSGIPLLIVSEAGVDGGIFGISQNESGVYAICIEKDWDTIESASTFSNWLADVQEQSRSMASA